jgi:hypothetical protein
MDFYPITCLRFAAENLSNSLQLNELWIILGRNFGLKRWESMVNDLEVDYSPALIRGVAGLLREVGWP